MLEFKENLYFVATDDENFGRVIAHRTNRAPKLLCDIFEFLDISPDEQRFLKRNIRSGGDCPIIIRSCEGCIIVERSMLYSVGVCCFITDNGEYDGVNLFCKYALANSVAPIHFSVGATLFASDFRSADLGIRAYAKTSEVLGLFERICKCEKPDLYLTLDTACGLMGCVFELSDVGENPYLESYGVMCDCAALSFSVFIMAFVSRMISEKHVLAVRRDGRTVNISTKCQYEKEVFRVLGYLCTVLHTKGQPPKVLWNGEEFCLGVSPFYADVGLAGVKNPVGEQYNIREIYNFERNLLWQITEEEE